MTTYEIRLFGNPEIWLDNQELKMDDKPKRMRALFYYLISNTERQSRHNLALFLWGKDTPLSSQNNMRATIHHLRKIFPDLFSIDRYFIQFTPPPNLFVDVHAFEQMHEKRIQSINIAELENALALYRGNFLEHFAFEGSPDFSAWKMQRASELQRKALAIMMQLLRLYIEQGLPEKGLRLSERLLALEPHNDAVILARMQCFEKMGQRDQAIQEYLAYEKYLHHKNLPLTNSALITEYQQVSRSPSTRLSTSLPRQITSFFGREAEIQHIQRLILSEKHALLTFLGPGGMGKTRLAIEVGHRLSDYFDRRVFFVSLRDFSPTTPADAEKEFILKICRALRFSPNIPGNLTEQLYEVLQNLHVLLILDNVEPNAHIALLITDLVQHLPYIQIISTSRERLKIRGETIITVGGLSYPKTDSLPPQPDVDFLRTFPCLQMLEERAQRMQSSFTLDEKNGWYVARICEMLGGMPLGIEIVAHQLTYKHAKQIAQEIEHNLDSLEMDTLDADGQASLRTVMDTSWQRLSAERKQDVILCALFQGGFTREAFTSVAMQRPEQTLQTLLDSAIIQITAPERFSLHPVVQRYVRSLNSEYTTDLLRRYSHYYMEYLIAGEDAPDGQFRPILDIQVEKANIEQAWQYAVNMGDFDLLRASSYAIASFYKRLGMIQQGREILRTTAEHLEKAHAASPARDAALSAIWLELSHIEELHGNLEEACRLPEVALQLAEKLNDAALLARTHHRHAAVAFLQKDLTKIVAESKTSLEYALQSGNQRLILSGMLALGVGYRLTGQYQLSIELYQQAISEPAWHSHPLMGTLYHELGGSYFALERLTEALKMRRKGLENREKFADKSGQALSHLGIGHIYKALGQLELAYQTYEQGLAMSITLQSVRFQCIAQCMMSHIEIWQGQLDSARQTIEKAEALARTSKLDILENCLFSKARLMLMLGNTAQVDQCIEEIITLRKTSGPHTPYLLALQIEQALNRNDVATAMQLAETLSQQEPQTVYLASEYGDSFEIYLSLFRAYQAAGSPRAADVLHQAHAALEHLRQNIPDPDEHPALLNIPARRALEDAFLSMKK